MATVLPAPRADLAMGAQVGPATAATVAVYRELGTPLARFTEAEVPVITLARAAETADTQVASVVSDLADRSEQVLAIPVVSVERDREAAALVGRDREAAALAEAILAVDSAGAIPVVSAAGELTSVAVGVATLGATAKL